MQAPRLRAAQASRRGGGRAGVVGDGATHARSSVCATRTACARASSRQGTRDRRSIVVRAAEPATEALPTPTIKIDNTSDPFATVIKVDFGDRLGDLIDTIQAIKNMGYNITRAKLSGESKNKFFITDAKSSEKVTKSAELEDIRQCIMHTMVDFHPEAEELVSLSAAEQPTVSGAVLGAAANPSSRPTEIKLKNEGDVPFTRMEVTTRDRPGLLVDIVRTLKDCNIQVLSAEVDTIGLEAQDYFMLAYHGQPLNRQMRTLVRNALQYYLALAEIETEESY